MESTERPFLFQSVRDVVNVKVADTREFGPSTLVVIGRDLDKEAYQTAFARSPKDTRSARGRFSLIRRRQQQRE